MLRLLFAKYLLVGRKKVQTQFFPTVGVEITMPMSAKAWMVVMTWKIVFTYHHHQVEQLLLPIRRESELWTSL